MTRLSPKEVDRLLSESPRETIYMVGAGGIGMSALGHLLIDLGFSVAGSDLQINDEVRKLQARGATIHCGHSAEQMERSQPVVLVYSSAVLMENPELEAGRRLEIPSIRRATLLAGLVRRQHGVCVAGMHGKTTTAAMLAYALKEMGFEPSFAIGGSVPQLGGNARFSRNEWVSLMGDDGSAAELPMDDTFFVVEADESDGTLLQFEPEHSLILNVDEEHLDYFESFDAISAEFEAFGAQTSGTVFYCADDPNLVKMFGTREQAVSYGFNPLADYCIELIKDKRRQGVFEVWRGDDRLGEFSTRLLGAKNVSNAGGVIAFLSENHFGAEDIACAISNFKGAQRRQQLLFQGNDIRVYEDYAHHPLEISATIEAFRELDPKRLIVAFQPHRYTRTRHLLGDFGTCFRGADTVFLTEVYAASEEPIPGVNGEVVAAAVRSNGQATIYEKELDGLVRRIHDLLQPGDVVIFLGAGDISRAARQVAGQMRFDMSANNHEMRVACLRERLTTESLVKVNEPLAKKTTMRVGGVADIYVEPATEADLAELLKFCTEEELPIMPLGKGSNLVIRDGGIRGVVVSFNHPNYSSIKADGLTMRCGAGVKLKDVAIAARENGIAGLEFMEGIPGCVGGGLRMNAGAMGRETFECVESIRVMDRDGKVHDLKREDIEVKYRSCPLLKDAFALSVVLRGEAGETATIAGRMKEFSEKRWASQPKNSSAGCMFKNLDFIPAGKLIDELGLKGMSVGGAQISSVHGNFMVNAKGEATARDVIDLIGIAKRRALEERGIELRTEVQIVGED